MGRGDGFIQEKAVENWISSTHLTERHFSIREGNTTGQ